MRFAKLIESGDGLVIGHDLPFILMKLNNSYYKNAPWKRIVLQMFLDICMVVQESNKLFIDGQYKNMIKPNKLKNKYMYVYQF